jgi:signal transduction histidine kinase
MRSAAKSRKSTGWGFEKQYRSALCGYALSGEEAELKRAYELGRGGIEGGKSLIEITSIHHKALADLVAETEDSRLQAKLLRASAAFLAETLSPYEMAHRGFQEGVQALRQLNETLEEEIKRIAYAVHDEAGQLLVAVHLALADLSRELPEAQQDQIGQVAQLLDQVEKQLRRYSHDLRPTILDDLGWLPAIRFLAEGVTKRANIPIRVETSVAGRLPNAVEIALYRIVQEALTNATKHSKANRVSIRVRREVGVLCCSIRDDGSGFDVQAVQSDRKRRGLGLIGMQERLNAIGGTLSIRSAPGHGTTLTIRLPVGRG